MPIRIPAARSTELYTFAGAGAFVLAPLYMLMPGATERMATQTARWAPRWERNISYFTAPVERTTQRITPPVERTVRRIESRLPLGSVARGVDSRIRRGMTRFGWAPPPRSA
ncbi:hypothetical protein DHEL01_v210274 [Diaporthe helianthi]|uniref:4-coumarate:coenzyme A ligase n=1 Tax=Diaporthe helianthi TaxID=158607 RepID=A0A2P5HM40_DIAHE|nr:hypothetical protein DHEL01_v210274 [Diaporthe helianthi]